MNLTLKNYIVLTKQTIVLFVLISVYASYYFASGTLSIAFNHWPLFLGIYLSTSGAQAINQLLEMKYDGQMQRTKDRPLPSNKLSRRFVLVFGLSLMIIGIIICAIINWEAAVIIGLSAIIYLLFYTPLKRKTLVNTWVGAISGALPALSGWVVVRDDWNFYGFFIFLIVYFWQIPHFLSLAWKYKDQYEQAGFKMLVTLDKNGNFVGAIMLVHVIMIVLLSLIPNLISEFSIIYTIIVLALGIWGIVLTIKFLSIKTIKSANRIFGYCNYYLLGLYVSFIFL